MKTNHIFGILASLFILLVFARAITNFNQPVAFAQNTNVVSTLQQVTPTSIAEDQSEVGSTDGILIMGIVIVAIVVTPLLFRKQRNNRQENH
ncbi:MAG: hypothetical protein ACYC6R_08900 [Anaerolineales bacterium]